MMQKIALKINGETAGFIKGKANSLQFTCRIKDCLGQLKVFVGDVRKYCPICKTRHNLDWFNEK